MNGSGGVELVVEAVLDRRADAELGLGEDVLHGLGHDVRRGVAQHHQAVGVAGQHRLDGRALTHRLVEVDQRTVDTGHDNAAQARHDLGQDVGPRRHAVEVPCLWLPGDDDVDLR